MQRNTLLEMSGRAMHMAVRFTLNQGNDSPMMQELTFDGMNSEGRDRVERVQSFGFTSTPLPRDQKQGQQSQSGGGGGTGGDVNRRKVRQRKASRCSWAASAIIRSSSPLTIAGIARWD
jgi:hypothetical protein